MQNPSGNLFIGSIQGTSTFLDEEVEYMLDHGLVETSNSSWASPCLLVAKADSTLLKGHWQVSLSARVRVS